MIYDEMLALRAVVQDTDSEHELQAVMDRIKRDIELRQDTDHAWQPEQVTRTRKWCRRHREWLQRTDNAVNAACYGWLQDRVVDKAESAVADGGDAV